MVGIRGQLIMGQYYSNNQERYVTCVTITSNSCHYVVMEYPV